MRHGIRQSLQSGENGFNRVKGEARIDGVSSAGGEGGAEITG